MVNMDANFLLFGVFCQEHNFCFLDVLEKTTLFAFIFDRTNKVLQAGFILCYQDSVMSISQVINILPIYLHPRDMICLPEYVLYVEVEQNWGQNTTLTHSSLYFNRFIQV